MFARAKPTIGLAAYPKYQRQTGDDIWIKGVFEVFTVNSSSKIIRPYFYDSETRHNSESKIKALGELAYQPGEYNGIKFWRWWYKAPSRPWTEVPRFDKHDPSNPPPLPRPASEWRSCGCREREHICGACGKPYWVEFHGVADGHCTYCYYHG